MSHLDAIANYFGPRMDETKNGVRVCIQRLEALEKEYEVYAEKHIWETGKGSLIAEGNLSGVRAALHAIRALDKTSAEIGRDKNEA